MLKVENKQKILEETKRLINVEEEMLNPLEERKAGDIPRYIFQRYIVECSYTRCKAKIKLNMQFLGQYICVNCRKKNIKGYCTNFQLILLLRCEPEKVKALRRSLGRTLFKKEQIYVNNYRYTPNYLNHLNSEEKRIVERLNELNTEVFEEHMNRIKECNFVPLEIVWTVECGLGVISHKPLLKGTLLCLYIEEIFTEDYMHRNKVIDGDDMFVLLASKHTSTSLVVNPCKFTNIARSMESNS